MEIVVQVPLPSFPAVVWSSVLALVSLVAPQGAGAAPVVAGFNVVPYASVVDPNTMFGIAASLARRRPTVGDWIASTNGLLLTCGFARTSPRGRRDTSPKAA